MRLIDSCMTQRLKDLLGPVTRVREKVKKKKVEGGGLRDEGGGLRVEG